MTQNEPLYINPSTHPNFIDDQSLFHNNEAVNNYLILENTPNFSANNPSEQIEGTEMEMKPKIKLENSHQSLISVNPLIPKPILRSNEKNKTYTPKLMGFSPLVKDEINENADRSPTNKVLRINDSSPNNNEFVSSASRKKNRQTRLFKGQIIENDIFEEKTSVPIVAKPTRFSKVYNFVQKMTENTYLEFFFNILVFYALFADDIRTIFLPKSADVVMDSITFLCIFVFTCEIFVSILTRKGYFNSFFFYLDIVSTLTLFFDLTYVYEQVLYKSAFANRFQIARASRATRMGTRAGRLIKFFNFEKFFQCLKRLRIKSEFLAKKLRKNTVDSSQISQNTANNAKNSAKTPRNKAKSSFAMGSSPSLQESSASAISGFVHRLSKYAMKSFSLATTDDMDDKPATKESRVGKKLSELTTKRVILIVLLLLLFVPVFSADYQFTKPLYATYGIRTLANMAVGNATTSDINKTMLDFIDEARNSPKKLLAIVVPILNYSYYFEDLNDIRKADYDTVEFDGYFVAIDLRDANTLESIVNILRTLLICFIFLLGAMIFSKDANDLALRPIERMIEKVNKIANNPLMALDEGIRGTNQNMETVVIENAIIKIGTLLALGFGDAGSEIIAKNVSKGNSGSVNPLIPGKKHFAIFGFCDIRNFTDVTEVLQEEVMLFVNTIASIVHKTIDSHIGNANKNIGDAFLLVWKIPDAELSMKSEGLGLNRSKMVKSLCDLAVISYVKTIAKLNTHEKILKYSKNPKITARIPNYKVKMGFGLHLGWAIEGAIGSIFKIDASYLSPNVNIASRLEAATKQYGVPMLISDAIYEFCSKLMQRVLRQIDKITVKGSLNPLGLYTVDMNLENLIERNEKKNKTRKSANHKKKKKLLMERLDNDEMKIKNIIENDEDLVKTLTYDEEGFYYQFREIFQQGLDEYFMGKWKEAKESLEKCLEIKLSDGPTTTLLKYMETMNFQAPDSWKGYRELTEK